MNLKFGIGNAKLDTTIGTFSLPAGHTCPFAKECLSFSDRFTGKITDGKHCKFRCFAAMGEARATNVRNARWNNFDALKEADSVINMGKLIQEFIPQTIEKVRVHVSGDFFSEKYFLAWLNVAKNNPNKIFYGYTKAIPFLVKYRKMIPKNFRFTASKGGKFDSLIALHKLRCAEVVFSVNEAKEKNLEIDHDDSHAINGKKSFALLLHGSQPTGTKAAEAWNLIRKSGIGGYSRQNQTRKHSVIDNGFKVFVDLNDTKKKKVYA